MDEARLNAKFKANISHRRVGKQKSYIQTKTKTTT